ncbi:hypothetical protein [Cedratvirus kamchatka]|uniref:Uncharacterized protein n=1 Tax=Cedratvirus kamchatka TaxID=2716914 RepID=A0A6G8MYH9_9VIRU|nr:hypothetical protein [Cedratvirus kamchatka]WIL04421.1 hypothetical protein Clen_491 [Cedratvirus lena]WIL05013.1 hypothetical protein Cduv_533 [Cedratvirus duvanny]
MSNSTYLTFNITRNGNLLQTHMEAALPQGKLVIDAEGSSFVSLRYNINSALIYTRDELGILFTRPYKIVWKENGRYEERVYKVDDNLPYHPSFVGDYSVKVVNLEVIEEEEDEFWNEDEDGREEYDELDEYEEEPYLEEEEY